MKKFKLSPRSLDKFIHQNKAEIIDGYEGCLLDNYLYQGKRGIIAIYESYVNPNMSEYLVIFSSDKEEINTIWNEFNENIRMEEQTA